MGPVHFLFGAFGAALVAAAIANESPFGLLVSVLTGDDSRRAPLYTGPTVTASVAPAVTAGGGDAGPNDPAGPRMLVPIGQGSHRLAPAAAAGFRAWQAAYGFPIPVTDSYRPYAEQARQHARNPDRFAHPDKSAHVDGTAVDVNLQYLGISGPGAALDRLHAAGTATGWHFKGRSGPMHASYGAAR